MSALKLLGGALGLALIGIAVFVYGGLFDVAADRPHANAFLWLVETTRERSIARRAKNLEVPPLNTPELISAGGPDYEEMCSGCHLKPGIATSEIRSALYPRPPNLAQERRKDPAQTFWIIKHGIKMSGMPAWGATHDDQRMWAIVAFLQQLPRLTPEQYQVLTARGEDDEELQDHGARDHGASMGDAAPPSLADTPQAAVDAFFQALITGKAQQAQSWLASDVLIFESGHAEHSRAQYLHEHLPEDIKALAGVRVTKLERSGSASGDLAWVASRVKMSKPKDKAGGGAFSTETMVLKRQPDGWRIQHIHWSSAAGPASTQ